MVPNVLVWGHWVDGNKGGEQKIKTKGEDFGTLDQDCLIVDIQELRHLIKNMSWGPEGLNIVSHHT